MRPSVFSYRDYKSYLLAHIQSLPGGGYGFRVRMAELMECDISFVTKIINGPAHLNLEQAESLQGVLFHDDEDAVFFLALVLLARARTPRLRARAEALIESLQVASHRGRGRLVD